MVRKFDFLVIGSGIAGMSFALKVAHKGKVALICKSGLEEEMCIRDSPCGPVPTTAAPTGTSSPAT